MNTLSLHDRVKAQLNSDLEPGKDYFEDPSVYEAEILTGVKWEKVPYSHSKLDHHCPYKQGQLTVVVGHTNVGKTTLILYLLARVMTNSTKKLIVYSAENRISQIARHLISFSTGTHRYSDHFDWIRKRVLFIRHAKQFTYRDMLEQTAIADDMGFESDMIFIDPYNALKVDSRMNGHNYHYEAIEDMRIHCMQTRKSIFLNCHTVTEAQRVKADEWGEIPAPMMSDVEGGGKFPNKADDVWVLHRNIYHKDPTQRYVTQLHVGKVRNREGGGEPTPWKDPILYTFRRDWTGFDEQLSDGERVGEFVGSNYHESSVEKLF